MSFNQSVSIKIKAKTGHIFDQSMYSCHVNYKGSKIVAKILACILLVPLASIFVLYSKIHANIKKQINPDLIFKQKTSDGIQIENEPTEATETTKHNSDNGDTETAILKKQPDSSEIDETLNLKPKSDKKKRKDLIVALRFSKGLFVPYALTAFSLISILAIFVFEFDQTSSAYIKMYIWLGYQMCATLNPIIYPLFNPTFWHGYKNAINAIKSSCSLMDQKTRQLRLFLTRALHHDLL